jgi:hypothetical protein
LLKSKGEKSEQKFNIGRSKLKQTELFFNLKLVLGKVISTQALQSREGKNDHGSFQPTRKYFSKGHFS